MAKKKKVRWGVQWEKVASGGAAFLIAGGICLGIWLATSMIYVWLAAIAFVGFVIMLTGLMGEDGVW